MNKSFFLLLALFFCFQIQAQIADSTLVETDEEILDTVRVFIPENGIQNNQAMLSFYDKLMAIGTANNSAIPKKINIVHIGDSHIQADLLTDKVRKNLQNVFGNAGRGLVFPHSLAKTNGASAIRFSSNKSWQNHRIVSVPDGSPVGLSGIALYANNNDFAIALQTKEVADAFNTIKIITPKNQNRFDLATAKKIIVFEATVPKKIVHKIKSGEAISIIADKYNVSISAIKKANGLRSNTIRAGKSLKIPTNEKQQKKIERTEFIPLEIQSDTFSHFYKSEASLNEIYLIPNKSDNYFALNGVVLENNASGILYHSIGVNGAKLSDYNKYPMFFEQLQALQPDLVIIALGTNESFDNKNGDDYMNELDLFLESVRAQNGNVAVLVVTPPPSLFKRKYPNLFVADYAKKISEYAEQKNYAVWDLFSQFGGLYGVRRNFNKGLMANDRVHYTKAGYEAQGDLLSEAILKTFENYQKTKR